MIAYQLTSYVDGTDIARRFKCLEPEYSNSKRPNEPKADGADGSAASAASTACEGSAHGGRLRIRPGQIHFMHRRLRRPGDAPDSPAVWEAVNELDIDVLPYMREAHNSLQVGERMSNHFAVQTACTAWGGFASPAVRAVSSPISVEASITAGGPEVRELRRFRVRDPEDADDVHTLSYSMGNLWHEFRNS